MNVLFNCRFSSSKLVCMLVAVFRRLLLNPTNSPISYGIEKTQEDKALFIYNRNKNIAFYNFNNQFWINWALKLCVNKLRCLKFS